jgi:hypothetical protein
MESPRVALSPSPPPPVSVSVSWWRRVHSQWIWILFAGLAVLLLILLIALVCTVCADKSQLRSAARSRQTSLDDTWVQRLKVAVVGEGTHEAHPSMAWLQTPKTTGTVSAAHDYLKPLPLPASSSSSSRFLVLRNYNNDGGFFWQIYNLLCAAHVAQINRMSLIVLFDTGLYLERNADFLEQHRSTVSPTNWFHSYFEGQAEMHDARIAALIQQRSPLIFHAPALELRDGKPVNLIHANVSSSLQIFEFTRSTFEKRPLDVDYGACWRWAARPLPYITAKVATFMHRHKLDSDNCFLIGIHFRGSDKYGNGDDDEDGPVHYEYEWCEQMVRREMKDAAKQGRHNCKVLVCSDEQPFIEFMRARLPAARVVYTSAIRSSVNTGGKHYETKDCIDERSASPDCVEYRNLKHQSVHRGMPDHSAHQKGEDVLIDVLLLSKCHVFLRSRGNVSNFPGYINSHMRIIDLADAYTK